MVDPHGAVHGDVIETLRAELERNAAAVHGPTPAAEAAPLVAARTAALSRGAPVAVPAGDEVLDALGVVAGLASRGIPIVAPDHPDWRAAVAEAAVGVTGAVAGAAEVGTVAVPCGVGSPRSVSLLPEAHLCVLPVRTLHPTFEAALAALIAAGPLPSNLAWIAGPSRSADIEKRITLGVHGPRTFEVVLVED